MLKKLGWALVALAMLAGLARAAGDGSGGMSIASLASVIANLGTTIGNAISGSSVPTSGPGSSASAGIGVQGLGDGAVPVNTAPKSGTPNIHTTATLAATNASLTITAGPLAGLGLQVGGNPSGLNLTAACSQDKGATYPVPLRFAYKGTLALANAPIAAVTAAGNYKLVGTDCDAIVFTATALTSGSAVLDVVQTFAGDRVNVFNTPAEPLNAVLPAVPAIAPTDRGTTITTGGTSQQLVAANASRKGLFCQNPVDAVEDAYFAVAGAATIKGAGNFADVAPGGSVAFALNALPILAAIQVNAATAGHRVLCTEIQ